MSEISRSFTVSASPGSPTGNPLARWLTLIVLIVFAIPLLGLAIIVGTVAVIAVAAFIAASLLWRRMRGWFDRGPQRENVRVRRPDGDDSLR